jgi:hypothetical protein
MLDYTHIPLREIDFEVATVGLLVVVVVVGGGGLSCHFRCKPHPTLQRGVITTEGLL